MQKGVTTRIAVDAVTAEHPPEDRYILGVVAHGSWVTRNVSM